MAQAASISQYVGIGMGTRFSIRTDGETEQVWRGEWIDV